MKSIDKFVLVLVASLALLLAGCGGGSSTTTPPAPPPPTAYEMALTAINAATTPAEAQKAYDDVKGQVTATEGEQLQQAIVNRTNALATMARQQVQQEDLMAATGAVDTSDLSTQELVDAARAAIAGLRQAIDDAVDVADTSMYQSTLDAAIAAVDEAQGGIDTATRRTEQMMGLSDASGMLQTALAALSGSTPTQAQLDDANAAVTALKEAIAAGADLTDAEKATYVREAANAAAPIDTAQMAFDDAMKAAQDKADMEMMAMAAKLYTAIGDGPLGGGRAAAIETATGDNEGKLRVTTATGATPTHLKVDKMAMVDPLHGWEGSQHTATVETGTNAGTYTAQMYANVGEPTPGAKFNSGADAPTLPGGGTAVVGIHYAGFALDDTTNAATIGSASGNAPNTASRISSPQFVHSAGTHTFKFPEDNPTGQSVIRFPGSSYWGVAGTYTCTPGTANACTVTKAADGYTLDGGAEWKFIPGDPNARVTAMPDSNYVVYGWWLYEPATGDAVVSAFADLRGTVDTATIAIAGLNGSATYKGGAAGKYTVRAGAVNDAGHFTADAELMANFENETVTGTINNFMGSDGMSRDWSVALGASVLADGGAITGDPDDSTDTGPQETTWTMGGTADSAGGQWSGNLRAVNASSGVPQVGTGTFHSTYGNIGRMVGAFGVNLEE